MQFTFKPVAQHNLNTVLSWLDEPHMQEFWDNSDAHRADIQNFVNGRKMPAKYFNGVFSYWIGFIDESAFCFILTSSSENLVCYVNQNAGCLIFDKTISSLRS